ncbi:uncharacterized protein LOC129019525 isoform X2 [Pongo pygmaeus]|uniref:uncharacterized protein LOC129019525 isoform X2 n=1 Tax=Pongo pygmaeus TaxID=9600 RepID=UPI0023E1C969|nr:uncharacterized protein LOC129019525 isoform X2 [Pongo pygmaeus]
MVTPPIPQGPHPVPFCPCSVPSLINSHLHCSALAAAWMAAPACLQAPSLVMVPLLQAGGDLQLHDQRGRTPQDWAEQGGAKQNWELLELLQLCRAHISAFVHDGELPPMASLDQLQARFGNSPPGSLSSLRLMQADSLLWMGHKMTVRQLKAPGTQTDVLLADLQHCRQQKGYPWGGPGPGLPPPPELYPWLPLELICSDMPTTTSDLYSFCILTQEVFTEKLYCELAHRAKTTPRPVPPVMSPGLIPSQARDS